jgi:hypothetical protein
MNVMTKHTGVPGDFFTRDQTLQSIEEIIAWTLCRVCQLLSKAQNFAYSLGTLLRCKLRYSLHRT